MSQINTGKVIAGGLVAGVVFNLIDFVINGFLLKADFAANATRLGLDAASQETPAVIATWIIVDFIFGLVVDDCLHSSFSLHSQFRIGDSASQALLQKLDSLLETFFPAHEIAWFDLITGEKETEESYAMPADPAVADWVNAAPDRWLHVQNKSDGKTPRFVGARPIRIKA